MADGKVLLEVVVEGKNVKVVQREVEQVTDAVNENTTAQNRNSRAARQNAASANEAAKAHEHFDRGLKGSAGASSNGTKNFSKMRDAMGGSSGLVGAYATLAANLFAATAAFAALQRAAQVEQLTQGLVALGQASGLAMVSLSKGLQESTKYSISLQDAMRQVAQVTSAGFDTSVIERLGTVATNTSIALGRDVQDSMNRLVKGATKLEPELLDELGIMVRIDEASQKYAESMGKSASQLTNFEKRQAFMNAVLEEGERKFGAIGDSVDANPYDKLSATLQELGATVLNVFNVVLSPIVGFLADSKLALAGLIAIFSKGIIGQALPALSQMANATAALAVRTSQEAEIASEAAKIEVEARKSSITSLEAVLGKRGELIDSALEEAGSLQELSKVQVTVNKSLKAREAIERKNPGSQTNQIKALEDYKKELEAIIKLEAERIAKQAGGGDDAIKSRTDFLVKGAERINSLDEAPTFKNYKEEFMGALDDAKKLREELAASGGAVTPFSESISQLGEKASEFGSKMSEAGGISAIAGKTLSVLGRTVTGLGASLGTGATAWRSFGTAAKIAIKGIFTAIPIIGEILFFVDLLKSAISGLINFFRSDASKEYSESLSAASDTTKELAKNSIEVSKAITGSSKSITSSSALIEAQANIVSQVSDSFYKLKDAAAAANESNSGAIDNLNEQIKGNVLLENELKNLTGGYSDLNKYIKDKNLSEQQATKIAVQYIESINKISQAQLNMVKTLEETNQAFSQYYNTLFQTTQYTNYINKLEDVTKALQSARDERDRTGNSAEFNTAIDAAFSKLSPDQAKYLGLEEVQTQLKSATERAESFSGAVADIKSVNFRLNFSAQDVKKVEDAIKDTGLNLRKLGLEQITGEKDRVKILEIIENFAKKAAERAKQLSEEGEKRLAQELETQTALDISLNTLTKEKNALEYINSLTKLSGFETKKNFDLRQKLQNKVYTDEISYITDQITQQQKLVDDTTKSDADRRAAEIKVNELIYKRGQIAAEQTNFLASKEIENAKTIYSNLETRMTGEKELLSILEKELALSKSILDSRVNLAETSLQIQNLQEGGTGNLSASQQLKVFSDFEKEKAANINKEYNLKLRTINLEEKLNTAKLAILNAELSKLVKEERAKLTGNQSQDSETIANIKALEDAQVGLRDVNYAGLAVQQRTQANLDREQGIQGQKLQGLQLARQVNEETRQVSVDLAQTQIDIANVVGNIQDKYNSSRSSILDSERTIRENELKAINLRNKGIGQYELTAQQMLELEIEFGDKKKALIQQEESSKLKMIELEYALLEAQLKVQQAGMETTFSTLKTQGATEEKIAELRDLSTKAFTGALALLPEAQRAASDEVRQGTKASISEIEAGQIQALEKVFGWTTKMQTSWEDVSNAIGQNFLNTLENAKSITQELADAFTNSINAAVDAFVDAIVEGKNAFKAIGDALRNSLRDSFAEAAKNKLKEGIAGIGSTVMGQIPGLKDIGGDFTKLLQGPQERAAVAAESTTTGITETNRLLALIETNTKTCCSSMIQPAQQAVPYVPTPGKLTDTKGNPIVGLSKKDNQLLSGTSDSSLETAAASTKNNWLTETWGKAQTYATENVGTIAASGFASIVTAIAAGRSTKSSILGGILGIAGSVVGGMVGGPAGAAAGGQMGAMLGARADFAKGGVMSSSGSMPLQKYARGGIANSPQLAMFGEGSRPEAYVPLPDGRSIPVTMSNGGGNVNNISVNVAVEGGQAQTQTQSGDNTEEYSRRLGTAISNAVKQEMINQQRPGGLLYRGRR